MIHVFDWERGWGWGWVGMGLGLGLTPSDTSLNLRGYTGHWKLASNQVAQWYNSVISLCANWILMHYLSESSIKKKSTKQHF